MAFSAAQNHASDISQAIDQLIQRTLLYEQARLREGPTEHVIYLKRSRDDAERILFSRLTNLLEQII